MLLVTDLFLLLVVQRGGSVLNFKTKLPLKLLRQKKPQKYPQDSVFDMCYNSGKKNIFKLSPNSQS